MKKKFILPEKPFRYQDIQLLVFNFLGHVEKWLDLKGQVNFKNFSVTIWLKNISQLPGYNTHVNQHLKK